MSAVSDLVAPWVCHVIHRPLVLRFPFFDVSGTAYFVRNKSTTGGDGRRPGGYPIFYTAGPGKAADASPDNGAPSGGNGGGSGGNGSKAPTADTTAPK